MFCFICVLLHSAPPENLYSALFLFFRIKIQRRIRNSSADSPRDRNIPNNGMISNDLTGWWFAFTPRKIHHGTQKNGSWEDDFPFFELGKPFLGSSRSFCRGWIRPMNWGADLETKIHSFRCKEWRNPWNRTMHPFHHIYKLLVGGFKYFSFSPLPGEMIPFDEHIFQMGWNHQLG